MINAYKSYWANYFNFRARTSRKSYWLVVLASFIVEVLIAFILTLVFKNNVDLSTIKRMEDLMEALKDPTGMINVVWVLINVIPKISIDIRRLHDINKSGWFFFINLVPVVGSLIYLVWLCSKSVEENNNYGSQV